MSMLTHVTVGTNDLEKAGAFYASVLEPLGYRQLMTMGDHALLFGADSPQFGVFRPANGEPATFGNGVTISFAAPSRAAVDEFHRRALAAGGRDEGAPGPRPIMPNAYAAYVRDLDGNKLTTFCFAAE